MSNKAPDGEAISCEAQARAGNDLAALPEAVRAIVEECRAESAGSVAKPAASADGKQELPYPCRMYESVEGEEELLQLQWMRVDMSNMDSERCWGEPPGCNEEFDCGPASGLVLPAVYRVDPAQLFPLTFVGLPPELLRAQQSKGGTKQRVLDEVPEDHLCKLGRDITEALCVQQERRGEGLPPDMVEEVGSLGDADWSTCIERHVDLQRCDPAVLAQLLSTRAPPTLHCLLGTVLPSLLAAVSSRDTSTVCETSGRERGAEDPKGDERDRHLAAIGAICEVAASVAAAAGEDPVQFRERVSTSELRKLGPLGSKAEVALAEAFFYGAAGPQLFEA